MDNQLEHLNHDSFNAFKELFKNSNQKWKSAQTLAETKDYGSAISLSITSIEELIKSIINVLDARGFELKRIIGMESMLRDHQVKHITALSISIIGVIGEDFIHLLQMFKEKPNELFKLLKSIQKDGPDHSKLKGYVLKKIIVFKNEFKWFSKLEQMRREGLYCDFNGKLKSPMQINHDDYLEVHYKLKKIHDFGKIIIESYLDNSYEDLLKDVLHQVKSNNIYEQISQSIVEKRKSRKNPFNIIADQLDIEL